MNGPTLLNQASSTDTKILQRPDLVWSRMELKPDEVLLVEVSEHAVRNLEAIAEMADRAFGPKNAHRVLVYVKGNLKFAKVTAESLG